MFKLVSSPTFTATVTVSMPGGKPPETFTASFRLPGAETLAGFDLSTMDGQRAFLEEVMIGANDLVDEDGEPLSWSADLRSRLIDTVPVRRGLIAAFERELVGAREKN